MANTFSRGKKSKLLQKWGVKLYGRRLEFRVRLYNILASAGLLLSLISGISGIFTNSGMLNLALNIATGALSAFLLWYSLKTGKYQLCYVISVTVIFLALFPALFLSVGGYHSGMPMFFVFAFLFTVFMLDGKKMLVLSSIELVAYTSLCLYAYFYPETIARFKTETDLLVDIIVCFLIVSISLGVTMFLHFRLYKEQLRELEAARKQAEDYARMKSELFAGMSHEMRTPLTVMSAYAQFAVEQIRNEGANEQTLADLTTISDEAKRLAEMADGTLKILSSASETEEAGKRAAAPANMGDLSRRLTRLLEPVVSRKGRRLTTDIESEISGIRGDADELTQLIWNLLHNAITHSEGDIAFNAGMAGGSVVITVKDDGEGIDPQILPRVFEHGISSKKGGSGIGLPICREIAKRHGGDVAIESEAGKGTCVTVRLKGITEEATGG